MREKPIEQWMYEDPELFRQARRRLDASRREVAEAAEVKETSVSDVEYGRKRFRLELSYKLWGALWVIITNRRRANRQINMDRSQVEMVLAAHTYLDTLISPEKLLACQAGGHVNLTPLEERRLGEHIRTRIREHVETVVARREHGGNHA